MPLSESKSRLSESNRSLELPATELPPIIPPTGIIIGVGEKRASIAVFFGVEIGGDLGFLREIPVSDRPRWRLAPFEMTYGEAHRWARDEVRADKVIRLSTGETLVRLRQGAPSPWGLPS